MNTPSFPYTQPFWINTGRVLIAAVLAVMLIACGSPPQPNPGQDFDIALTVRLSSGATQEQIEQKFGGKVVVWEAETGFAILGLSQEAAEHLKHNQLSMQSVSGLETNGGAFLAGAAMARMSGVSSYWADGLSTYWADGISNFWAGGLSSFWADGLSTFWADGIFQWMPQNTTAWKQIGLDKAQYMAKNLGMGVKIAVIDTGVDLSHPALVQALAPASERWDFVDNDGLPQEKGTLGMGGYGHGTNVAGIIRQIAPRATILPIRVLDEHGCGSITDVAAAINWAVAKGAQVINLSLGSDSYSLAVDYAIWAAVNKGVMVVASSGNEAKGEITFPASRARTSKQRISVTSVNPSDVKSSFANYASEVEVSAPGEMIYGPAPDLRKAAWSGTSMAAAIVSGAAGLALGEPLMVSKTELLYQLRINTDGIYHHSANQPFNQLLGNGRLNMPSFLSSVVQP